MFRCPNWRMLFILFVMLGTHPQIQNDIGPANHRVARSMSMSQQKNEEMADCNGIKTFSPSNIPWILRSSRSRPCLHQISQRYLLPTLPWQGPRTQATEPETHTSLVFSHVMKALQASILELGKTRNVHQTMNFTWDVTTSLPPCGPSFSHDPSRHSGQAWRTWDGSSSSISSSSWRAPKYPALKLL